MLLALIGECTVNNSIGNDHNAAVILSVCTAIQEHKAMLSEIDGEMGDGDHGVNMSKGFKLAEGRIPSDASISEACEIVSDTLIDDIGGSMGPIYGTFFSSCAEALSDCRVLDAQVCDRMLKDIVENLMDLTGAKPGDKTLIDTLIPAQAAFSEAYIQESSFALCLERMSIAAEMGWRATKAMQAQVGRAARLGERSIGHLDAGATSCCIILQTLAREIRDRLKDEA